jgi:hypothetical protein
MLFESPGPLWHPRLYLWFVSGSLKVRVAWRKRASARATRKAIVKKIKKKENELERLKVAGGQEEARRRPERARRSKEEPGGAEEAMKRPG